jgi:CubicO group peptidase (beta-lactamase class C family)
LPLDFEPGERFGYSNSGYIALGLIIERLAGMSYGAFVGAEILEPLGMRDSGYDEGDAGLATGYRAATTIADSIDMSIPHAAGGLYSTVIDMHRWDKALYTDVLVGSDLLATMFEPRVGGAGPGFSYGYGVVVGTYEGRSWISHGGGIDGFATWYGRHPDDRLAVILLANREDVGPYDMLDRAITQLVLDH